jgi:hypothetical protein
MPPRKLWPVRATASALGFEQDITLASRIKVTPTGTAADCVGRLVNLVWISDPDCSLAAAMPHFTGEAP